MNANKKHIVSVYFPMKITSHSFRRLWLILKQPPNSSCKLHSASHSRGFIIVAFTLHHLFFLSLQTSTHLFKAGFKGFKGARIPGLPPTQGLPPNRFNVYFSSMMLTGLRHSCWTLLVIVLVRPNLSLAPGLHQLNPTVHLFHKSFPS